MRYCGHVTAAHHDTVAVGAVYHLGAVWLQRPCFKHVGREVQPEVIEVDIHVIRRDATKGIGTEGLIDALVCG